MKYSILVILVLGLVHFSIWYFFGNGREVDDKGYIKGSSLKSVVLKFNGKSNAGQCNTEIMIDGYVFVINEHIDNSVKLLIYKDKVLLLTKEKITLPVKLNFANNSLEIIDT